MRFTAQTARDYAAKSQAQRRFNRDLRKNQPIQPTFERELIPATQPIVATELADTFSLCLSSACEEMLERVRKAKKPIEAAQLARALRDLRETWHLATGKPRPGLTRPQDSRTMPRRELPRMVSPSVAGKHLDSQDQ